MVLVDMDGTLADVNHRLHQVRGVDEAKFLHWSKPADFRYATLSAATISDSFWQPSSPSPGSKFNPERTCGPAHCLYNAEFRFFTGVNRNAPDGKHSRAERDLRTAQGADGQGS